MSRGHFLLQLFSARSILLFLLDFFKLLILRSREVEFDFFNWRVSRTRRRVQERIAVIKFDPEDRNCSINRCMELNHNHFCLEIAWRFWYSLWQWCNYKVNRSIIAYKHTCTGWIRLTASMAFHFSRNQRLNSIFLYSDESNVIRDLHTGFSIRTNQALYTHRRNRFSKLPCKSWKHIYTRRWRNR